MNQPRAAGSVTVTFIHRGRTISKTFAIREDDIVLLGGKKKTAQVGKAALDRMLRALIGSVP